MNYTKLITKKKQYKYSVNICLDLRTEERLADFIPNLTTTEIIRELRCLRTDFHQALALHMLSVYQTEVQ